MKDSFEATLEKIKEDKGESASIGIDDENLILSASKMEDPQYETRNELYTNLLSEYIEEYKSKSSRKKRYKLTFFVVTLLVFIFLVIAPIIIIYCVAINTNYESDRIADIAAIAGSVAGIISAVAILPKIIAEHLFPTDEETHLIDMVKNMQQNDTNIRDHLRSNKKEKP